MFPFLLLFSLILIFAMTSDQPGQERELHHPDVNVNIFRDLPAEVTERMWPVWFDRDLFPQHGDRLRLTDEEWRERLSLSEFRILRNDGTEMPFVNEYHQEDREGIYLCRACSAPLFSSAAKFHSRSGWPSFFAPVDLNFVGVRPDRSLLSERTEVHCARCDSHLGHVFDDGPPPTGLRYCMNSLALRLIDRQSHERIRQGREEELGFPLHR